MLPDPALIHQLSVFDRIHKDPVVAAFFDMLEHHSAESARLLQKASHFTALLYETMNPDWSAYLKQTVLEQKTCLQAYAIQNQPVPAVILEALNWQLEFLEQCARIRPQDIHPNLRSEWLVSPVEIRDSFLNRALHLSQYGTGKFSRYHMFRVERQGKKARIVPVKNPDEVSLEELWGYKREREAILSNTLALLEGKPANNLLLYGAAGTGKSASIKAVVNELKDQGLRLVEVDKEHLDLLPSLLDRLADNPLKFILFIDDLSFGESDDRYALLKAVLEGSSAARSSNLAIYATSNRRHVIKESMKEREQDVHQFDHIQEMTSLSDRFGLQILFERPDKKQYLQMARFLADQQGLEISDAELEREAERFALSKGVRSARSVRHLITSLLVKQAQLADEMDSDEMA